MTLSGQGKGLAVMDLVTSLRSFLRVAQVGSFSAVAVERGVTQPAISRQISGLEEHLGVRLVHRNTQSVTLTEEGRHFLVPARDIVETADAMLQSASLRRASPVGAVRIGVQSAFALAFVQSMRELLMQHKELSIDLVIKDRLGSLLEEGLDLEVRLSAVDDTTQVARRIGHARGLVVAAPSYLHGASTPSHPRQLADHQCLRHQEEGGDVWWYAARPTDESHVVADVPVAVGGRFSANQYGAIHHAVLAGHGIAYLPAFVVSEDLRARRLIRILEGFHFRGWPVYVTYATRRGLPPRVRVVLDFIVELLNRPGQSDEPTVASPGGVLSDWGVNDESLPT